MSEQETTPESAARIVDLKIPLHWLLGVCGVIAWALISMYFSVGKLVETVNELQIDVKVGNSSIASVASKLALVEYRQADIENRVSRMENRQEAPK